MKYHYHIYIQLGRWLFNQIISFQGCLLLISYTRKYFLVLHVLVFTHLKMSPYRDPQLQVGEEITRICLMQDHTFGNFIV